MSVSWRNIEEIMTMCFRLHYSEWNVELPPFDSLPTPALEQVVDEWCAVFVRDPTAELNPPAEVKPWLLARLIIGAQFARSCAERPGAPKPPKKWDAEAFYEFLVVDWAAYLSNLWTMLMAVQCDEDQ